MENLSRPKKHSVTSKLPPNSSAASTTRGTLFINARPMVSMQKTGVGTGTIHFPLDPTTGSPTAFQFGPGDPFHTVRIAIGRLEPIAPGR
jgi:hypothetical protein